MSGEKSKMAADIAKSIVEHARNRVAKSYREQELTFNQTLVDWRLALEKDITKQTAALEEQQKRELTRHLSIGRWDITKHLRNERKALIARLVDDVETRIMAFTQTEGYRDYINAALEVLQQNGQLEYSTLMVRACDINLFAQGNYRVVSGEQVLGGFVCHHGNQEIDYTLDQRMIDETKRIVDESQLWI